MKARRHASSQFGAPWGRGVRIATVAVTLLVVGLAVVLPVAVPRKEIWPALLGPGIGFVVLGITALFCVRGYAVRHRELWIQRSFWQTRLPLKDLQRAFADPQAMKGTTRSAGNGGFTAYTGWFRSRKLGSYRAFVTDPALCVVLEFQNRKVVVSPDNPAAFVRALGFEPNLQRSAD